MSLALSAGQRRFSSTHRSGRSNTNFRNMHNLITGGHQGEAFLCERVTPQSHHHNERYWSGTGTWRVFITCSLTHYSYSILRKDFINSTEDGGLTEADFNSFVDSLIDEIDMLPWIWNKAPDSPSCDDRFLQFRKGYLLEMFSSFTLTCRYHLPWCSFPCEISLHPVWRWASQ